MIDFIRRNRKILIIILAAIPPVVILSILFFPGKPDNLPVKPDNLIYDPSPASREYIRNSADLKTLVNVTRQIRTGCEQGITFADFCDKQTKFRDAFALIDLEKCPEPIRKIIGETMKRSTDCRINWSNPDSKQWQIEKVSNVSEALIEEYEFLNSGKPKKHSIVDLEKKVFESHEKIKATCQRMKALLAIQWSPDLDKILKDLGLETEKTIDRYYVSLSPGDKRESLCKSFQTSGALAYCFLTVSLRYENKEDQKKDFDKMLSAYEETDRLAESLGVPNPVRP